MDYWIQRADFEAIEGSASSAREASRLFEAHDWATELRYRAQREATESDWCDPGFGLVAHDGRILHLCPKAGEPMLCHYHFPHEYRFLGLFRMRRQETESWWHSGPASVLIDLFFANQHDMLVRYAHGR